MRQNRENKAAVAWWSFLEIASRYGVQFVVTIVLARLLAVADIGLIAMLLVFTSVGALLTDAGFGAALVRRQREDADDEVTAFACSMGIGSVVAITLWFGAPIISRFYEQPGLASLARAMAFVVPLGALGAVPDSLLTMRLDFKARTRAQMIASLASGAVAIAMAWRGCGAWSMVAQALLAVGIRSMALWIYSRWRPRGRFRRSSFRALFGFGGFLLLSGLLDTLSIRLQSLLIGKLFDARVLGSYTIAQNTQQAPTSIIGAFLGRIGLPVFSKLTDRPEELRAAFRVSLRVTLFVFVPSMVGLALLAKPFIALLYGTRWLDAAPVLTVLALAAALWPLHSLNLTALIAHGHSNLFFRLEIIKKLIAIGLVIVCGPFGPVAVAASVLFASLLGVFINTWYSGKLLDYGAMSQLRDQLGTIVLSMIAAVPAWGILHWTKLGLVPASLAVLAALAVYLIGAKIARNPALNDLLYALRTVSPKVAFTKGPSNAHD